MQEEGWWYVWAGPGRWLKTDCSYVKIFCTGLALTLVEADKALVAPEPITTKTASLPIHPAAHITTPHHPIRSLCWQIWTAGINPTTTELELWTACLLKTKGVEGTFSLCYTFDVEEDGDQKHENVE